MSSRREGYGVGRDPGGHLATAAMYLYTGCISLAMPMMAPGRKLSNSSNNSRMLVLYFRSRSSWIIRRISGGKKKTIIRHRHTSWEAQLFIENEVEGAEKDTRLFLPSLKMQSYRSSKGPSCVSNPLCKTRSLHKQLSCIFLSNCRHIFCLKAGDHVLQFRPTILV